MKTNQTRRCPRCKTDKPLSEWTKRPQRINGVGAYCLPCHRNYMRDHYKRRKTTGITRRQGWKGYGIDPVAAETALAAHKGVCECCGATRAGNRDWHVDHDHATGRIRGVLCHNCNVGIGQLGDTLAGVLKAAQYLMKGLRNELGFLVHGHASAVVPDGGDRFRLAEELADRVGVDLLRVRQHGLCVCGMEGGLGAHLCIGYIHFAGAAAANGRPAACARARHNEHVAL